MTQTKAQLIDGKSAEIEFTGGSASAPAISFTGDTNTGIYSPGADQVAISTNGTGRLFVDSSGRVGIGASGPGFPLEVRATSSTGQVQILGSDNTNATWRIATPSSNVVAFGGAPFHIVAFGGFDNITQAFTERMRLDTSGRLGLGTSSPSNRFQSTQSVSRSSPPAAGASGHELALGSSSYGIVAGTTTGGSSYIASTRWDGTATNYSLLLNPNGGNVGVGTTSPAGPLHVYRGPTHGEVFRLAGSPDGDVRSLTISTEAVEGLNGALYRFNIASGAGTYAFSVNNTEALRITSDRYVRFASGSLGIQFNGDTAAANALDDYEEGTFTPFLAADTGGTWPGSTSDSGKYIKIGTLVFVYGSASWSSKPAGATGTVRFKGLPFGSTGTADPAPYIRWNSTEQFDAIRIQSDTNLCHFRAGGSSQAPAAFGASGSITFSFPYQTS